MWYMRCHSTSVSSGSAPTTSGRSALSITVAAISGGSRPCANASPQPVMPSSVSTSTNVAERWLTQPCENANGSASGLLRTWIDDVGDLHVTSSTSGDGWPVSAVRSQSRSVCTSKSRMSAARSAESPPRSTPSGSERSPSSQYRRSGVAANGAKIGEVFPQRPDVAP